MTKPDTVPSFAFIIPVLNEAPTIAAQLQSLQQWRQQGHEVIVVDGGSQDATTAVAQPLADQVLHSPPGRAAQMNLGAQHAAADVLLFLHADTRLPAQALQLVSQAMSRHQGQWGWFDARLSDATGLLAVVGKAMSLRARITRVCTGDQAMFVQRSLFVATGGFPDLPLMEDVAMSKRLRQRAKACVVAQSVVTSSRRWQEKGVWRTILLMWQLRLLYFLGVPPHRLVARYYPGRPQADS